MNCPICGSGSYKESYQCPAMGGEPVCADCCRSCEYHGREGLRCRWYLAHPQRNIDEEINTLRRQADLLKKKKDALWERGKRAAAMTVEEEWRLIWQKIRRLEKERDEKGA